MLWVKLIKQDEKREKWIKTCNEAVLRDKLRVVSGISLPQLCNFQNFIHNRQLLFVNHEHIQRSACDVIVLEKLRFQDLKQITVK